MSVWRIGVTAASRKHAMAGLGEETEKENQNPIQAVMDKLTKWIPGDVLALYVAAVAALSAGGLRASLVVLLCATLFTPLVVIAAAFAKDHVTKRVWVAAILATVAFGIWSVSVPLSWWQHLPVVQANQAAFSIGAAALGVLFGYVAEGVLKRADS